MGACKDVSDVRAFIDTVGILRIFIENFATRALPITKLFRKGVEFKFETEEIVMQEDLKEAVKDSPALRPLSYIRRPVRLYLPLTQDLPRSVIISLNVTLLIHQFVILPGSDR